jgi:hypothetical protein
MGLGGRQLLGPQLSGKDRMMQLNRHTWNACDDLVDKFCCGDVSETDFVERGLALGMPQEDLHGVITSVRDEDGN